MTFLELRQRLRDLGAKPDHEGAVLRSWLAGRALDGRIPRGRPFPGKLVAGLPALAEELAAIARVRSVHPAEDGSARLLIGLGDGQVVESVLLRRDGLCVSSQVGCAVGCSFCMTGRSGLIRQLTAMEILSQLVLARAQRPVHKVVFMGMGEPAHNLNAVLEAVELMGTVAGLAAERIFLSTVGDHRVFERLPQGRVKPVLALSLHTTRAELRERLLPKAPRIAPDELVELANGYAESRRYPVLYQWTLLEGINDTEEEIAGLVRLLRGKRAVLNLIPFNSIPGSEFRRPEWERAAWMARTLHQRGVLTKLRRSNGQDVDGGCGQLRARAGA
jgi:23S rRNA (adenine2503-C2)-methyltransferase